MRYADGPTVEVEVRVAAPPDRLWPVVSDITVPPRFSTECQETTWEAGTSGPGPGARFQGRNRHDAIGEWTSTCTVTDCTPAERFGWDVDSGHGGVAASWRFELVADGGGTILRQWARMGPGPSGLSPAIKAMPEKEERIIARRMEEWRANMVRTVEGIRDLVEDGDGSPD